MAFSAKDLIKKSKLMATMAFGAVALSLTPMLVKAQSKATPDQARAKQAQNVIEQKKKNILASIQDYVGAEEYGRLTKAGFGGFQVYIANEENDQRIDIVASKQYAEDKKANVSNTAYFGMIFTDKNKTEKADVRTATEERRSYLLTSLEFSKDDRVLTSSFKISKEGTGFTFIDLEQKEEKYSGASLQNVDVLRSAYIDQEKSTVKNDFQYWNKQVDDIYQLVAEKKAANGKDFVGKYKQEFSKYNVEQWNDQFSEKRKIDKSVKIEKPAKEKIGKVMPGDTVNFKNFMLREKEMTPEQKKYGKQVIETFAKTKRTDEELQQIFGDNYSAMTQGKHSFNFKHEMRRGATGILMLEIAQKDTLVFNRFAGDTVKNKKGQYHTDQVMYRMADTVIYQLLPGYGNPASAPVKRSEHIGMRKNEFLKETPSGMVRFLMESSDVNNEISIKNGNGQNPLMPTLMDTRDYRVRPGNEEAKTQDRLYLRQTDSTLMPYPNKTVGTPRQEIDQMQNAANLFFRQQINALVSGVYDRDWQKSVAGIHPNDAKMKVSHRSNVDPRTDMRPDLKLNQEQQNKLKQQPDYTKGAPNVGTLGTLPNTFHKEEQQASPVRTHKKKPTP